MAPRQLRLVATGPATRRRTLPALTEQDLKLLAAPAPPATPKPEPGAAQLEELVRVQAGAGRMLTIAAETRLLEYGVLELSLTYEDSRLAVERTARAAGIALQRQVEPVIRTFLLAAAGPRARITASQFDAALALYRTRTRGALSRAVAEQRTRAIMSEAGLRPARRMWLFGTRPDRPR